MTAMIENKDAYSVWVRMQHALKKLIELNCEDLLDMLKEGSLPLDAAKNELSYALAEARWKHARSACPELKTLSQVDRHALVKCFKELEISRVDEVRRVIKDKHLNQIPKGAAGEMGLIRGEIAKKTQT